MNIVKQFARDFAFPSRNPYIFESIRANSYRTQMPIKGFLKFKEPINKKNFYMRLGFPEEEKYLGTKISEFVSLKFQFSKNRVIDKENNVFSRYYSPISRITDKGFVDFAVSIQRDSQNKLQPMTKALLEMKDGDEVYIDGPYGSFSYSGHGNFNLKKNDSSITENFKDIGLIADGSGITAFFQILEAIASSSDPTCVSLLYTGKEMDDLILMEELEFFKSIDKLKLAFSVEESNGIVLNSQISKTIVKDFMPPPSDETVIFVCGGNDYRNTIVHYLKELGYSERSIWPRFTPFLKRP